MGLTFGFAVVAVGLSVKVEAGVIGSLPRNVRACAFAWCHDTACRTLAITTTSGSGWFDAAAVNTHGGGWQRTTTSSHRRYIMDMPKRNGEDDACGPDPAADVDDIDGLLTKWLSGWIFPFS